jgi:hypothetical protein
MHQENGRLHAAKPRPEDRGFPRWEIDRKHPGF